MRAIIVGLVMLLVGCGSSTRTTGGHVLIFERKERPEPRSISTTALPFPTGTGSSTKPGGSSAERDASLLASVDPMRSPKLAARERPFNPGWARNLNNGLRAIPHVSWSASIGRSQEQLHPARRMNQVSKTAFILSLIGGVGSLLSTEFFLLCIVAFILGLVGLVQALVRKDRGVGFAIGAILISFLAITLIAFSAWAEGILAFLRGH